MRSARQAAWGTLALLLLLGPPARARTPARSEPLPAVKVGCYDSPERFRYRYEFEDTFDLSGEKTVLLWTNQPKITVKRVRPIYEKVARLVRPFFIENGYRRFLDGELRRQIQIVVLPVDQLNDSKCFEKVEAVGRADRSIWRKGNMIAYVSPVEFEDTLVHELMHLYCGRIFIIPALAGLSDRKEHRLIEKFIRFYEASLL